MLAQLAVQFYDVLDAQFAGCVQLPERLEGCQQPFVLRRKLVADGLLDALRVGIVLRQEVVYVFRVYVGCFQSQYAYASLQRVCDLLLVAIAEQQAPVVSREGRDGDLLRNPAAVARRACNNHGKQRLTGFVAHPFQRVRVQHLLIDFKGLTGHVLGRDAAGDYGIADDDRARVPLQPVHTLLLHAALYDDRISLLHDVALVEQLLGQFLFPVSLLLDPRLQLAVWRYYQARTLSERQVHNAPRRVSPAAMQVQYVIVSAPQQRLGLFSLSRNIVLGFPSHVVSQQLDVLADHGVFVVVVVQYPHGVLIK